MALIKLRGLAVREVEFGEYDRYLTILTDEGRKIEVLCKGVRRGGKRQLAAARAFCYAEYLLTESKEKFTLREAESLHNYFAVSVDIEQFALASYLAEVALTAVSDDLPNEEVTQLLLLALHALTRQKRPCVVVKAAFEWRLMALCGYTPQLGVCGVCGRPIEGPPVCFSVRGGTAACGACGARVGGYQRLENAALQAMVHSVTCEIRRVFAFALEGSALQQFARLGEQYLTYHLARGFDTLDFYHTVCNAGKPQ